MLGKPVHELTPEDLEKWPVWQFCTGDEDIIDETWVEPVEELPVGSLDNRIVGTLCHLANGEARWCTLSNVDLKYPEATEHFVLLSIFHENAWLHLPRYFDEEYVHSGPTELCDKLGLEKEEVFPIFYDISAIAEGADESTSRKIPAEPSKRLTDRELRMLNMSTLE